MALRKPDVIKQDGCKSAKWDEVTKGKSFTSADVPLLTLLCQWYQVQSQCMDDITQGEKMHVFFQDEFGNLKPLPQLDIAKKASGEIRALNKQLGIVDNENNRDIQEKKVTVVNLVQKRREERQSRATG